MQTNLLQSARLTLRFEGQRLKGCCIAGYAGKPAVPQPFRHLLGCSNAAQPRRSSGSPVSTSLLIELQIRFCPSRPNNENVSLVELHTFIGGACFQLLERDLVVLQQSVLDALGLCVAEVVEQDATANDASLAPS